MAKRNEDLNDDLKDRLSRSSEINISVTGRKSGRTISNPVWFVAEDEQGLSSAREGIGHAVVQERAQEAVDSGTGWGTLRPNLKLFRSVMLSKFRRWWRDSEPSTGPAT